MSYETAEKLLYNEALSAVEKVNKDILTVYLKAQADIESQLLQYQKQKMSGVYPYVPAAEEFRLKALYQQIDEQIDKLQSEIKSMIESGYVANMELAYYKHAYNMEREINLGLILGTMALNYPVLPASAITATMNEMIAGFNLSDRWGEITANAKFRMRGLVSETLAKGNTVKDLAKELKAMDDWIEGYAGRSITVARTEMLRAYSYGQDAARVEAEDAGVEFVYKWSSTLDSRTRDLHVKMNNKTAAIVEGQPVFTTTDGFKAAGPRMPGLPAKHTVNCRCRRLDLPYGIEPTVRVAKTPDGKYTDVPFNTNAEEWTDHYYGKKI